MKGGARLGWRGVLGVGEEVGAHLKLWRKSKGEAPELIDRPDAKNMPVMFWRHVTWEGEGREGGRVCHVGQDLRGTWGSSQLLSSSLGFSRSFSVLLSPSRVPLLCLTLAFMFLTWSL